MANYPSSNPSFTTKATNDVIAASHMNSVQDEIVAIGTALRTSLQHNLLFTDATYDIGASGATRPRDLFLSRNAVIGGTLTVAGQAVIAAAYPVGSIYISTVSTNPNTLFGFGTWAAFATGRTIVGIDAGQTEFDTVEETGGAKTHTLTSSEMPAHTHSVAFATNAGTNAVVGSADAPASAGSQNTGSTGGGGAHNNLQPYIVVYMWKRTA